ncbi:MULTISPECIES: hypothetical protein [Holospora]|uniref:hypothetical protein n=1 Tax=Holospora TaxID=44747 RepID=UPI0003A6FC6D|nr:MULTISPECIES: hypothetical protein [Holospora]
MDFVFLNFLAISILGGIFLWGCRPGPSISPKSSYFSSPCVAISAEKIQVVEQEALVSSWNTLLDVNLVDMVRQWTKSAFSCSGSGPTFNVEIIEAKLAPLKEVQPTSSDADENTYVGILGVRVFMGKNPLLSKQSHTVHSKVSMVIPSHYTLKERRQVVLSLAEEVIESLHKEVLRYLEVQDRLRK